MYSENKILALKAILTPTIADIFMFCDELSKSYNSPSAIHARFKNDPDFDFPKHFSWFCTVSGFITQYITHVSRAGSQYHNLDYFYNECFYADGPRRSSEAEFEKFSAEATTLMTAIELALELEEQIKTLGLTDKDWIVTTASGYNLINETVKKINTVLLLMLTRVELMVKTIPQNQHILPTTRLQISRKSVIAGLRDVCGSKEKIINSDQLQFAIFIDNVAYKIDDVVFFAIPSTPIEISSNG